MNAVIYCRVSSREQVEGTSLESQESACREYARQHNLTVQEIFIGQGESAKFADRPELIELLAYCKDRRHKIDVLLVWKLDRFARNVEDHFAIKAVLRQHGVRVVSVTEPIQADPTGQLMETILAGFAQFDNDIRAARAKMGMAHRLREGIWPWKPPLGYLPPKAGKKTQPDKPDPARFQYIQAAWKLFLTGGYSKADVLRQLQEWGVSGRHGGHLGPQVLDHMFADPFYAGILRDPWSGNEYEGKHVPMITPTEFARVQQLKQRKSRSVPHTRHHPAFPLRGHVKCPTCEQPMTAGFARGRCRTYAYYTCRQPGCATRRKSYPAPVVHREFSEFIARLSIPADEMTHALRTVIKCHEADDCERQARVARARADVARVERQLNELVAMRSAKLLDDEEYRQNRSILRGELERLQSQEILQDVRPLAAGEISEFAMWMADIEGLWCDLSIDQKHGFVNQLFGQGYVFQKIQTPQPSLVFRSFQESSDDNTNWVHPPLEDSNTIIVAIRTFLAVVSPPDPAEKIAA